MLVSIKLHCPNCQSTKIVKNGNKKNKKQNYLCKTCKRQFIGDKITIQALDTPANLSGKNTDALTILQRILNEETTKTKRIRSSKATPDKTAYSTRGEPFFAPFFLKTIFPQKKM